MVESNNATNKPATQLPATSNNAAEESKDTTEDSQLMFGTKEEFSRSIKEKLSEIHMNQLEYALLDKFLEDPDSCSDKITDLLKKIAAKMETQGDRYGLKRIKKVIPLFDKHDFWSTQPVMRVYDQFAGDALNGPIEKK